MSRIQRFRPTGAAVVTGAVIGTIALAGCGAGQIAQTGSQVSAVVGSSATVGQVSVRDAQIEFADDAEGANIYPRGGAAPLQMTIVNSAVQPDTLVSASSPVAESVQISGESEIASGRVLLVEGAPAAAAPARPPASAAATSAGAPGSGEPAASPTAAPSAAAPSSAAPSGAASTPAVQSSAIAAPAATPSTEAPLPGQRQGQIVLTGLKDDIRAGLTYPVVLNFERAGQITVNVPVGYPSAPRKDDQPE